MSNNSLLSLWNRKVHYRAHNRPPLDPILSQPNPVRPIDPCLSKIHLNVIFPPTPRSSQWSLTFGPPNQNPVNTSPLPHACYYHHRHHSSSLFRFYTGFCIHILGNVSVGCNCCFPSYGIDVSSRTHFYMEGGIFCSSNSWKCCTKARQDCCCCWR